MSSAVRAVSPVDITLQALRPRVKWRFWLLSDLQQSNLAQAKRCLQTAVEDFQSWQLSCQGIWYLGDAVEGSNVELVQQMTNMQCHILGTLQTPVHYVMGNHDFDLWKEHGSGPVDERVPFWSMVRQQTGWRTTADLAQFHYTVQFGRWLVVFLSDHASVQHDWFTSHGKVRGQSHAYPWCSEDYQAVTAAAAAWSGPVILASHYALAGGNRPAPLLDQLLPLPNNVMLHCYGHSHIGDAIWGKEHVHRKIAGVHYHDVPQVNVSSLEDRRGSEVRSVLLELYDDDSVGVYFRDHRRRTWADALMHGPPLGWALENI